MTWLAKCSKKQLQSSLDQRITVTSCLYVCNQEAYADYSVAMEYYHLVKRTYCPQINDEKYLLSLQGEHDIPDASKWTDEELGIPPDDED